MALPEAPVRLRSVGALSASGRGAASIWDAALRAEPLGAPVRRYDVEKLRTKNAALLPEALRSEILARWSGVDLAVALAMEAIHDATRGGFSRGAALLVGTSLGCTASWEPWHRALVEGGSLPPAPAGAAHGDVAWQVAERLAIFGPRLTVSTACTSGSQALLLASDMIRLGEVDEALVVAVDVLSPFVHVGFDALRALSPDSRPPVPFDASRGGLWLGEGAACAHLVRGGEGVATLRAGACAGDGFHMTAPEPSGRGLAQAIRAALREGQCSPAEIAWISAHGTGTVYNDDMEASAFREVFGGDSPPPIHCLKPVLGHTLGASGLLEIVLLCEAFRRREIPPSAPAKMDVAYHPLRFVNASEFHTGPVLSVNSAFAGHNTALLFEAP